jgi:hypothetical protein
VLRVIAAGMADAHQTDRLHILRYMIFNPDEDRVIFTAVITSLFARAVIIKHFSRGSADPLDF